MSLVLINIDIALFLGLELFLKVIVSTVIRDSAWLGCLCRNTDV